MQRVVLMDKKDIDKKIFDKLELLRQPYKKDTQAYKKDGFENVFQDFFPFIHKTARSKIRRQI